MNVDPREVSRAAVREVWWSQGRPFSGPMVLVVEEVAPDEFEAFIYNGPGGRYLGITAHPLPLAVAKDAAVQMAEMSPPRGMAHIFDPDWRPLW